MATGKEASSDQLINNLARATGVDAKDVTKVLNKLGFSRLFPQAVAGNKGKAPSLESTKIAFRIGKNTVIH